MEDDEKIGDVCIMSSGLVYYKEHNRRWATVSPNSGPWILGMVDLVVGEEVLEASWSL